MSDSFHNISVQILQPPNNALQITRGLAVEQISAANQFYLLYLIDSECQFQIYKALGKPGFIVRRQVRE